jgi:LacI family transcriptional regulator
MNWAEFAAVALDYSMVKPGIHRVCNHHLHTITMTLEHVIQLGYRRIGLAMQTDSDQRVDYCYRSGYLLYID